MNIHDTTLIIGASGKTGRRVTEELVARRRAVRPASRSTTPRFDWSAPATWAGAVEGVRSVYLTYHPDLGLPGAAADITAFTKLAVEGGVRRIVLLSGRGEPGVLASEDAVKASGADWTIVRAAFFAQNFSEGWLLPSVLGGAIAFPAGYVAEPFVDCGDVAEVVARALTEDGHAGTTYELTGPRLLTFGAAAEEIARAAGRDVRYLPVSKEAYAEALAEHLPAEQVRFMSDLFAHVLDGHNAFVTPDVERVLGRRARDFADFAREAAREGCWRT